MPHKEPSVSEIKMKFVERLMTNFLDVITLAYFRNDSFSGYDVLMFVQKEFGLLLSAGTVYSKLYSMEREGLIEMVSTNRKRIYKLTELGKLTADVVTSTDEIMVFLAKIKKQ